MNYAVINDLTNIVENVVVVDDGSSWQPPAGFYAVDLADSGAGIGWSYDPQTGQFTPPPPPPSPDDAGDQPNVIG